MLKNLALVSVGILVGSQAFATLPLPKGEFRGAGMSKTAQQVSNYQVAMTVTESSLSSVYTIGDGTKKEWKFDVVFENYGLFKVKSDGVEVGAGYCLDSATVCHYDVTLGKLHLEETFGSHDGKTIFRYGSKNDGTGQVHGQESAERK